MKELYKSLISAHVQLQLMTLIMAVAGYLASFSYGETAVAITLGLIITWVFVSSFIRIFTRLNWNWLRSLPIPRKHLQALVLLDAVLPIVMGTVIGALLTYVEFGNSAEFRKAIESFSDIQNITYQHAVIFTLDLLISVSVLGYVYKPGSFYRGAFPVKSKRFLIGYSILAVIAAGLLWSSTLTIYILAGVSFAAFAKMGIESIYPTKKARKYSRIYAGVTFALVMVQLPLQTEVWTQPEDRAIARIIDYGILAPKLSTTEAIRLVANPKVSFEQRKLLLERIWSASSADSRVSGQTVREWAAAASDSTLFFEGLSMYSKQLWTAEALIQLEVEINNKCGSSLGVTSLKTNWSCTVGDIKLRDIHLVVENTPDVTALIAPEHPIIASLLIASGIRKEWKKDWGVPIRKIASTNEVVIAESAKRWLEREKINPSGKWDCSLFNEFRGNSNCPEARFNSEIAGLKLESKVANNYGSTLRLVVAEDQNRY